MAYDMSTQMTVMKRSLEFLQLCAEVTLPMWIGNEMRKLDIQLLENLDTQD